MKANNLQYALIILLTFSTLLLSQQINNVSIYGTVTDSTSSQPLAGVLVEVINEADTSNRA
jgi:hypothetical protein